MAKNRQPKILLKADEDALLRRLYVHYAIPSDQFTRRLEFWDSFTEEFNQMTSNSYTREEILHYIRTKRKQGKWVTLDGAHKRLSSVGDAELPEAVWAVLKDTYLEICEGSDRFGHKAGLGQDLANRVLSATGVACSPELLMSALVDVRKQGHLPHLPKTDGDEDFGFRDIDKIA